MEENGFENNESRSFFDELEEIYGQTNQTASNGPDCEDLLEGLNDEQRETLILRIQETLSNPDIICQQDFSLAKLAKLINSNTTYVSQVINEKYGMAFSNLLGSYRIRVACQWMDEPARYGNLTIEAIASGTGFKSRTTFVNAFKRETGLKPSEYLRMAAAKER